MIIGSSSGGFATVIYGVAGTSQTTIDLNELAQTKGFFISRAAADDYTGYSVAGAGDVNGDGRDDVLVGAYASDNNGRTDSGSSYLIYGTPGTSRTSINLNVLDQATGFRMDGAAGDLSGTSVSGAGDVNGDGRDDMIIGAPGAGNNGRGNSGSSYVVFGVAGTSQGAIDMTALAQSRGFRIDGEAASSGSGFAVSVAGDVTGDGRDDVIVGALYAGNNGRTSSGSSYLVGDAAPAAVGDSKTVAEDSGATTVDVLANDADDGLGTKTIASKTDGAHGTVAITNGGADLTYTPDAGYCGTDSFTYTLNGGSSATVAVTVTCGDDPPPSGDTTPPQTSKIGGKTKFKARKKAKFTFSADEADSTFECRVDKAAFKACASPFIVKTKKLKGKHTIEVRATDAAGNVDASPSSLKFKVLRKKRKK